MCGGGRCRRRACGPSDGLPVADPRPRRRRRVSRTGPDADLDGDRSVSEPPGILPTLQVPIPAGTVTCAAGREATDFGRAATVADPQAPKVTVGVPEGWSFTRGTGDVGAK